MHDPRLGRTEADGPTPRVTIGPVVGGRCGPYDLMAPLGRGGMGLVYRARHPKTGRTVALKTVDVLDPRRIASIRREIRALARLRHPGVVPILDDGVADGIPWYAMELVAGASLRQRLEGEASPVPRTLTDAPDALEQGPARRAERLPLPVSEALTIGARVAEALGHLHGQGLLHRDLKPSNILLRAPGDPVLIDFGLTVVYQAEQSRERLDVDPNRVGTPGYMAPEQARGEDFDARGDLYSLGCVLFEMLAALPFYEAQGERRPSRFRAGLPPVVDALVASLLDPDPGLRPADAPGLASRLVALGGASFGDVAPGAAPVALGRARFVGRDAVLERVEEALRAPGALVAIRGESGLGKTRLARELARRAEASGTGVLVGECRPPGGGGDTGTTTLGDVLHAFSEPLRAVADHLRGEHATDARESLGDHLRLLVGCVPEIASLPGVEASSEGDRLAPAAARRRIVEATHAVLTRFADGRPLLLVLDDLHWADDLSLLYVEMSERGELPPTPLRILATYRSEEAPPRLRALASARPEGHVLLERLSEDEMIRMAGSMLFQPDCPGDLARFLHERTGGNPYFIAEYLRAAVAEGWLQRAPGAGLLLRADPPDAEAASARRFTPESIRRLSRRRIQALNPVATGLAQHAAVVGRDCDMALLRATTGSDEEAILGGLVELVARHVLDEVAPGRYRFVHEQLRELVYQDLDATTRRRAHASVATAMDASAVSGAAVDHRTLAYHLFESGQVAPACEHLVRASDAAFAAGAYLQTADEIETVLRRSGAGPGGEIAPDRLAALHRRLSQAYMYAGDVDACARHSAATLEALSYPVPATGGVWLAVLGREALGQVAHLTVSRSRRRADETGPLEDAALAAGNLGRVGFFRNRPVQMIACGLWAVNLAERAGTFTDASRNYGGLGFTAGAIGAERLAERYFARARKVGLATADWPGLAFSLCSEGVYRAGRAEWTALRRAMATAIEVCDRTGDPQDADLARVILGHADHYQGRLDAAVAAYDDVLAQARRRANRQTIAWALYCGARSRIALGAFQEAREALDEAAALARASGDEMSIVAALGLTASLEAARGAPGAAATIAVDLVPRLRATSPTVFLIGHGYEGVAEFEVARLERRGDPAAAARAVAVFGGIARRFPVFQPAALRLLARLLAWGGAARGARAALEGAERVTAARDRGDVMRPS